MNKLDARNDKIFSISLQAKHLQSVRLKKSSQSRQQRVANSGKMEILQRTQESAPVSQILEITAKRPACRRVATTLSVHAQFPLR
jgi:uncharacterized protein YjdB